MARDIQGLLAGESDHAVLNRIFQRSMSLRSSPYRRVSLRSSLPPPEPAPSARICPDISYFLISRCNVFTRSFCLVEIPAVECLQAHDRQR